MKILIFISLMWLALTVSNAWSESNSIDNYKTVTMLDGIWVLSPADMQEGGATKKGPAAELIGTDKTAMTFKVVGKGSAVQENLLPDTDKEMVTMYHCDDFKNCTQVQAKHYCAKQNQPELILDNKNTNGFVIVMACDMNTPLCNSAEDHVHMIKHELSQDNNHLKTTYTIYSGGKFQKNSTYHFERKQ
jgi:hypothetical protein